MQATFMRHLNFVANMMTARILFWMVLFLPTCLALWRSGGERIWQSLLWAAAASAIPATLPRNVLVVVQWTTVIILPALLWWIGYAALNGIGPGWEAAVAVTYTTPREIKEAATLVIHTPGFLELAGICTFSLVTSLLISRKNGLQDVSPKRLKAILAAVLMPFTVSSLSAALGSPIPVLFLSSDASFSSLGTVTNLAMGGVDRALYGDLLDAQGKRRKGHAPHLATSASLAIFVIGEGVRAGGIGPQKAERGPWTKALDERMKVGLGTWLPTTCANAHATHQSVPLLMTGISPDHNAEASTAPSVLAVLKDAGYATAWISNQDTSVFKEDGHDFYWTISRTAAANGVYDDNLVPVAASFAVSLTNNASKPRAMALHMLGSHFDYIDRYPASLFPPEPTGLSADAQVDLRYERSEEYSAKVIGELGELLDRTTVPAFLVFSSDHGENLPSDHNGLKGHLGGRASIHDGTTTSFVIWNKAMAMTTRPKKLEPLLAAPMIAHADLAKVFLALADMAGTVFPEPEPKILAPLTLGEPMFRPNACALLKP